MQCWASAEDHIQMNCVKQTPQRFCDGEHQLAACKDTSQQLSRRVLAKSLQYWTLNASQQRSGSVSR